MNEMNEMNEMNSDGTVYPSINFLAASAGLTVLSQAAAIVQAYGGAAAFAVGATTFITGAVGAARIGGGWLVDHFAAARVGVGAHACSLAGAMLLMLEPTPLSAACPACGTPTEQSGKYWLCANGLDCRPQLVGRTELLASAFEVDRLGKKLIGQLVEHGLLQTPADVFHLDPARLLELERWGEKSVENLMQQLRERRRVPFDRFLLGIGIPEVGSATARLLARSFPDLAALSAASEEQLLDIEGIPAK